jgi:hypothetical protein
MIGRLVRSDCASLVQPRTGARCGRTDASRLILLKSRNGCGPVTNSVTSHHPEGHLSYSPCFLVKGRQDCRDSDLVPVPEQAPGRPHLEPVLGPARFTGLGPPSRWTSKGHDQVRVRIATGKQVNAPIDDGAVAPACALSPDALPRRPIRCPVHPAQRRRASPPTRSLVDAPDLSAGIAGVGQSDLDKTNVGHPPFISVSSWSTVHPQRL